MKIISKVIFLLTLTVLATWECSYATHIRAAEITSRRISH